MVNSKIEIENKVKWLTGLIGLLLLLLIPLTFISSVTTAIAAPEDIIIYGSSGYTSRQINEINLTTHSATSVGSVPVFNRATAQDPDTKHVYYFEMLTTGNEFGYWDPTTNSNTIVRIYSPSPGFNAVRMDFSPDGTLYVMDYLERLYILDKQTGDYVQVGQVSGMVSGPYNGTGDIAFAPNGTLYVNTYESLYTVDTGTLQASLIANDMIDITNQGATFWTGLAYCDGNLYASHAEQNTSLSAIFQIDPATGATILLFYTNTFLTDLTSCGPMPVLPTPTATNTPLPTSTNTPLPTVTNTPLPTATNTPLPTATNTPLPTATNTPLPTATNTPLPTTTNTPLPTITNTPLPTATNTPLPTMTNTPLPTATNTPLPTATNTPLPTATNTPLPTATNTPLPTATNTPLPTATPTAVPMPNIVYGSNSYGNQEMIAFDIDDNSYQAVGTIAFPTQAMGLDPFTGRVYYFDWRTTGNEFGYWDPATGTNTLVRFYNPAPGFYAKRMAFSPDGTLYLMDSQENLFIIDKITGDISFVGSVSGMVTGFLGGTGDMAFATDGALYVNTYENLYTVDLTTLQSTLIAEDMLNLPQPGLTLWTGLGYCDGYLYASNAEEFWGVSAFYRIDPVDGSATFLYYTNLIINDLTSCRP